MTHLTWEQLNDYADGAMTATARTLSSKHLDSCAECRATLARLRSLLASAKAAPASIEPPADAWTGIRETIDARKISALPQLQIPRDKPWSRVSWLVAAAVLLVVASSATTLMVVRRSAERVPGFTLAPNGGPLGSPGRLNTLPASFVDEERGYVNTVNALTATLNKSRDKLAPETVLAIEHSLRVIDDAIAEAREALARDPANSMLRDFLTKHYEQKVDFLRRVSGPAA